MTLTKMIITAAIIILGVYDLFAAFWGGVDITISRVMQDAGFSHPFVAFVVGGICSHFWMYMPPKCPNCNKDNNENRRVL